jgi:SNF family Na+-dependent transporter
MILINHYNDSPAISLYIAPDGVQVFFSLGVCMGVMTAYSSHNSKTKTNVAMSEKAISLR